MKLTFLGSGSAFYIGENMDDNFQSNILIESGNSKMLFDCGTDIRFALKKAGVSVSDITDVYISHLHADHIGGLEYLGFVKKFSGQKQPNLYIHSALAKPLWDSLAGGMRSIQGEVADIDTFFNVKKIKNNGMFIPSQTQGRIMLDLDEDVFQIVQSVHIMDGYSIVPSFGLMVATENDTKVFITSDSQFCPRQIEDFYKQADVIFQDCETSPYKSGVHAHYTDLVTLPDETRAKMWLYHFQPGPLPDAVADGFKGFIQRGQQFEF